MVLRSINFYGGTYSINHCLSDKRCHKESEGRNDGQDVDKPLDGVMGRKDGKDVGGGGGGGEGACGLTT